jgi:hypothetical protein
MEQAHKVSKIAGGFLAYAWQEGRKVMGSGKTEEAALADLEHNLLLVDRIRSRDFFDRGRPKA